MTSGIALQHADDGYSKLGNFGGSLIHNMENLFARCHQCVWFEVESLIA